ncbi:hypothetical protein CLV40_103326 [Actinokineospora auranticolor]|uniref:Uncharacterized protein n=1 Tax=Actinokineospora auranticolor TaxID=155976 RepID=A0A2S6GX04_9PSEU|nr:hypothetical protein CLV40_103326 [Actinokineospora auranticolor]
MTPPHPTDTAEAMPSTRTTETVTAGRRMAGESAW